MSAHDPEMVRRLGAAWRELRRGASMQALRPLLYGTDPDALDLGQVDTLDLLMERDGCRMSELADALRVDASTATRAVDRLVARGLVERMHPPEDRRTVTVRPTEEGRRHHDEMVKHRRSVLQQVLAEFTERDLERLAEDLERLVGAVDRFVRESGGPPR
jgi:DNA-binding MarR family transcriptional regulator